MKIGRLLLRLVVGGFFVGHGTQKLFGWFGGNGLDATAQGFDKMGLRPGRVQAIAAGAGEAGGGAGLALGLATPFSAALLTSVMLTAINRVHLKNGPWTAKGGYEYNVVLIVAALTVAELGPGKLSIDSALGTERSGTGWALAALVTGVIGAVGAHVYTELQPAPTPEPVAEPAAEDAAEPATSDEQVGATA